MVDLSKEVITCSSELRHGVIPERLAMGAVANTLTSLPGIDSVTILVEGTREGIIEGRRIEDFWGSVKLPQKLVRDESMIGKSGVKQPRWMTLDRSAIAEMWGWKEICRGNNNRKAVAFTFDCGGGIRGANMILDTLKEKGATSTFFLTGQFMKDHPQVVARIIGDGHEIGSHSFSHPDFVRTGHDLRAQLEATEAVFQEYCSYNMKPYFRFPYGSRNQALLEELRAAGYMSIYWTVDTLGWEEGTSPETVFSRVMRAASPGAIVLMHMDSLSDAQALSRLLDDFLISGYQAVTLSELLAPGQN